MKAFGKFAAIILISIAVLTFPGFDWRHILLLAAQVILIALV